MNRFEETARTIASDLTSLGLRFALVGGFAVSVRIEPRFTRDIDIAVAADDDRAAEAAVRSLVADGYVVLASVEHEATNRLATVRLDVHGEGDVVDLLFASSGIEPEIVAAADQIEVLPGLRLPVARAGHLTALKLLARDDETRPQDAGDLRALAAAMDDEEISLARQAVTLIHERGYERGRDLRAALDDLVGR